MTYLKLALYGSRYRLQVFERRAIEHASFLCVCRDSSLFRSFDLFWVNTRTLPENYSKIEHLDSLQEKELAENRPKRIVC